MGNPQPFCACLLHPPLLYLPFICSSRKWSVFSLALQKQIIFSLTSPKSPVNLDSCVFPLYTGMSYLPLQFSPAWIPALSLPSRPTLLHFTILQCVTNLLLKLLRGLYLQISRHSFFSPGHPPKGVLWNLIQPSSLLPVNTESTKTSGAGLCFVHTHTSLHILAESSYWGSCCRPCFPSKFCLS